MPILLFATHNSWKAQAFQPTFAAYGFELQTLRDVLLPYEMPAESGQTPVENALAKARACHSPAYPWTFGDDAALEVDALGGEPGVQARRWGGRFTDRISDQEWLDYLLRRLEGVPSGWRTACFASGYALVSPDGAAHTYTNRWPFEIAERPIRPMLPGSPMSAVRLGPPDDLARRQADILKLFQAWGIFERLLGSPAIFQ